jgi:hypothetical protein
MALAGTSARPFRAPRTNLHEDKPKHVCSDRLMWYDLLTAMLARVTMTVGPQLMGCWARHCRPTRRVSPRANPGRPSCPAIVVVSLGPAGSARTSRTANSSGWSASAEDELLDARFRREDPCEGQAPVRTPRPGIEPSRGPAVGIWWSETTGCGSAICAGITGRMGWIECRRAHGHLGHWQIPHVVPGA